MTKKVLNLEKEAKYLNGKERARLILKDAHEIMYFKKGFLSDREKQALLVMETRSMGEEYEKYTSMYQMTPIIMGSITEGYLRFKYYYESLKKAHLFINHAPAVELLTDMIKKGMAKDQKEDALKIVELLQAITISEDGKKVSFKKSLRYIREAVDSAHQYACVFVSMKKIVDRMTEELGFCPFKGRDFDESYNNYIEEIGLCIKEHNAFIEKIAKDRELTDKDNYLIPEPTFKTDVYYEWAESIFKDKYDE